MFRFPSRKKNSVLILCGEVERFSSSVYVRGEATLSFDDLRSDSIIGRGDDFQSFFDLLIKKFFCCFSMSYKKDEKKFKKACPFLSCF